MRIKLIKSIAILCFCIAFAVSVQAQSGSVFEIEIPFEFIVNDKRFPSGFYTFGRLSQTNPDILILKNAAAKLKAIFLTQRLNYVSTKNPSGLTFHRFGNIYFLNLIWASGEIFANQLVPNESQRKRRAAAGADSQLVRLTIK